MLTIKRADKNYPNHIISNVNSPYLKIRNYVLQNKCFDIDYIQIPKFIREVLNLPLDSFLNPDELSPILKDIKTIDVVTVNISSASKRKFELNERDLLFPFIYVFDAQKFFHRFRGINYILTISCDSQESSRIDESTKIIWTGDENVHINLIQTPGSFDPIEMGIGGLNKEFINVIRTTFLSRSYDKKTIKEYGIRHAKGIILYGPPGTGKTLMARSIGIIMNTAEPIIISGPELQDKFVGESAKKVANLFVPAKENPDKLHLIIIDELDCVTRPRTAHTGGSAGKDDIINQLLAEMDGVNKVDNVLIVGMTNRLELIEPALLRPGRFGIKIYIGPPDEQGRKEIFQIHLKTLIDNNHLAKDVDIDWLAKNTEELTGADISEIVEQARNYKLTEVTKITSKELIISKFKDIGDVEMKHLLLALEDVRNMKSIV